MMLNRYATEKRLAIFRDLQAGLPPSEGVYDPAVYQDALTKGSPQMGTTRYEPTRIHFEFIYPETGRTATILTVSIQPPEPIVFMPVPEWVVENIWQGEITGSYHFAREAAVLLDGFKAELEPKANAKWFGPQVARRRE